jgi:S-adenosylmethionine synthetase
MLVTKEQGAEGPYNNYRYVADGYANEVEYNLCKDMFDRYSQIQFRASDEGEESSEAGATSSKF